jgi:hypothetical protein
LRVEIAIAKLKKYKSPGTDQIPAELIQAGGETLWSEIHKFINSIWNKEELPDSGKSLLLYQFTRKVIKLTSNYRGISLLSTSYKILSNVLLSRLSPYVDEIIGDHQCGFRHNRSNADQIFCINRYWRKNGSIMRQYTSYSQTSREPMKPIVKSIQGNICLIHFLSKMV